MTWIHFRNKQVRLRHMSLLTTIKACKLAQVFVLLSNTIQCNNKGCKCLLVEPSTLFNRCIEEFNFCLFKSLTSVWNNFAQSESAEPRNEVSLLFRRAQQNFDDFTHLRFVPFKLNFKGRRETLIKFKNLLFSSGAFDKFRSSLEQ